MSNKEFTHVSSEGKPQMVNVSSKNSTLRTAKAQAIVDPGPEILEHFENGEIITKKGPVFQTAIIAGVMGAKKTSDLIPFCHPIALENCQIKIYLEGKMIYIDSEATTTGKTGVEMEALSAATIAALTLYDMCKALSHDIVIKEIKLMEKTGGKQDFKRVSQKL
jgi:cyclic pyranopterin monophosphate synthase